MAIITRDADGHADCESGHLPSDKCLICEGPSDAVWFTLPTPMTVCCGCAIDVLPRLIADAIAGKNRKSSLYWHGMHNEKEILLNFWRALTAASRPHNPPPSVR